MGRFFLDYLLYKDANGAFSPESFIDIYWPITWAAGILLIVTVILYNVQTRRLHRHFPLVNMQEWLLWTGLATFSLILVEATFRFYFVFVLLTIIIGVATFVWIRFFHFPPMIDAYNQQLKRARFYSQQKYRHPEATVRPKRSERARRRRRR
ncbi:MAG: hypothetical protein ABIZ34_04310 [Candidatus Limnocylindrales bacterium]